MRSLANRILDKMGFLPEKKKGLYEGDDEYTDVEMSDYYASGDPLTEKEERRASMSFSWWEWIIIGIEALLILYTILAFFEFVPLF